MWQLRIIKACRLTRGKVGLQVRLPGSSPFWWEQLVYGQVCLMTEVDGWWVPVSDTETWTYPRVTWYPGKVTQADWDMI